MRHRKGRLYRALKTLRGGSITLMDGWVLDTRRTGPVRWRAPARAVETLSIHRQLRDAGFGNGGRGSSAIRRRSRATSQKPTDYRTPPTPDNKWARAARAPRPAAPVHATAARGSSRHVAHRILPVACVRCAKPLREHFGPHPSGQGPTARYPQADEAPPPTGAAPSPPASPSPPSLRQEPPRARPAVSTLRPTRQGRKGDTAPPPAGWQVPRAS